jgi:putative peptidoglycan lipid II flippase
VVDKAAAGRTSGGTVARAAALIAVLTIASRIVGFGRVLVFNAAIGPTDLGDAYQTANTVPNVIFEIIAGGALAGLVVPLLAGALARGEIPWVERTVSVLLTWAVVGLSFAALAVALAAGPIAEILIDEADPAATAAGTVMLRVFAPQLPLYGVGIVLTGVLQTYRRFAWPVLAPLLSSLAVIGAYLVFVAVAGRGVRAAEVGDGGLLVLSVGTTLGVAVLSLCFLVPMRRLGLRLRPRWRLPADATATVRRLAGTGVVTVAAQQLTLLLAIAVAGRGPEGTVVIYGLTQTVFLLPWAVLAVPVATSAYPGLAEAGAAEDHEGFARVLAPATRSLLLLGGLGAALLVAGAWPIGRALAAITPHITPPGRIASAIAAFGLGLLGYGLFALLSRALYALRANRPVAVATVIGWSVVAVSSLALAWAMPVDRRVAALALANSLGMTALGIGLLAAVRRRAGAPALAGVGRTALVMLLAGTVATAAGLGGYALVGGGVLPGSSLRLPAPNLGAEAARGVLIAAIVAVVYVSVAAAVDRRDTRTLFAAVTRRMGRLTRGRKGRP